MRKEGKKQFSVWMDQVILEAAEREAADKNLTRNIFIENALREKLGFPPAEVDPSTPHIYIKKTPRNTASEP